MDNLNTTLYGIDTMTTLLVGNPMSVVNSFTEETKGILFEKHHRSSQDTLEFPLRLFLFLPVAVVGFVDMRVFLAS